MALRMAPLGPKGLGDRGIRGGKWIEKAGKAPQMDQETLCCGMCVRDVYPCQRASAKFLLQNLEMALRMAPLGPKGLGDRGIRGGKWIGTPEFARFSRRRQGALDPENALFRGP